MNGFLIHDVMLSMVLLLPLFAYIIVKIWQSEHAVWNRKGRSICEQDSTHKSESK